MLKANRFYCFSPAAMVVTFVIELCLAAYVVIRYKMNTVTRLATVILALLATFQLTEYEMCGRSTTTELAWSRVGYVAITFLPPLAIHLIYVIAKRKSRWLVWLAYATGITFAIIFGVSSSAFVGRECPGNYAIFQLVHPFGGIFFTYYYAWLFSGLGLSLYFSIGASRLVRTVLILQAFGFLSFILPTGVVNALSPQTISGIPSVMCGFAVIYALILGLGMVPLTQKNLLGSYRNSKN